MLPLLVSGQLPKRQVSQDKYPGDHYPWDNYHSENTLPTNTLGQLCMGTTSPVATTLVVKHPKDNHSYNKITNCQLLFRTACPLSFIFSFFFNHVSASCKLSSNNLSAASSSSIIGSDSGYDTIFISFYLYWLGPGSLQFS